MTSEQIGTWLAFDAVEPIGRAWERSGLLASLEMATAGQKFDADYFAPRPIAPQTTTAE